MTTPLLDFATSRRALLGGAFALAAASAARATAAPSTTAPGQTTLADRIAEQLGPEGPVRAELDALASQGRLSGVVAVALAGRTLFERAWGLADARRNVPNTVGTQFNIASMGKMLTAVAIARLAEQKRLSWQGRLVDHVPALPAGFADITIDHLLTHRSGLGDYFASPLYRERVGSSGTTVSDYLEVVRQDRPAFPPGSDYRYSNSGFVLLGAVIERLTGKDYFAALEQLVYRPAGMRRSAHLRLDRIGSGTARGYSSGCFGRPPSACSRSEPREVVDAGLKGTPAGGGYSTAGDLVRFADALRSGRLVRPATLQLMTRRHVDIARPGGPIDGYGYGFGLLRVEGRETFGHNGGTPGATAQLDLLKEQPLTIVVLANSDEGQRPASAILRRALLRAS